MKKLVLVLCFMFVTNVVWAESNATVKKNKALKKQQILQLQKRLEKKFKNVKTGLNKTNFMIKIETLLTIGTDNAGEFAKVMERDIGGCICQPLTGNPDQEIIPISCLCRKKSHEWKIEENKK